MNSKDLQRLKIEVRRLRETINEIAQKQARRAKAFQDALYSMDKIQEIIGQDTKDARDTRDFGHTKKKEDNDRNKPRRRQPLEKSSSSQSEGDLQRINGILTKYCQSTNTLCKKVNSLVKMNYNKESQFKEEYKQYLKDQNRLKKEIKQPVQQRQRKPKPVTKNPTPKKTEMYDEQLERQDDDILKLFQAIKQYM